MEILIAKSVAIMLKQPESVLNDKDNLIATYIVKGLHCFSKINQVVIAYRRKSITETRLEEIKYELSKVIFYVSCLSYLLDYESDYFNEEYIKAYAEDFFSEYKEDAILCSMKGMQSFINIADIIYSNESLFQEDFTEEDAEPEVQDEDIPVLQIVEPTSPGDEDLETEDELEEVDDPISEELALIFCTINLLVKRFELEMDSIERGIINVKV